MLHTTIKHSGQKQNHLFCSWLCGLRIWERPSWVVHLCSVWHHVGPLGLEDSIPQCFLTHIPGTIILTDVCLCFSLFLSPSVLPRPHIHPTWYLILEPKHRKQEAELLSFRNYSQNWQGVTSAGFILLVQAVKVQPGRRVEKWASLDGEMASPCCRRANGVADTGK